MPPICPAYGSRFKSNTTMKITLPKGRVIFMVALIDRLVGNVLDAALSDQLTADVFTTLPTPSPEEVATALPRLRKVIADRSRELAEQLGSIVTRKMKGARDAVALSADPVSQAANSLIELIDRLLRAAFTDQEVLDWISKNYPDEKQLRYVKDEKVRPTKLAQARCFVFAGEPKGDQPAFGELIAGVLVNARSELQRLKHADTGEPEELDELGQLIGAIEGFFALGVRLAWGQIPDDTLPQLYGRLDPKRFADASDVTLHEAS